jgi:hypothetical protein
MKASSSTDGTESAFTTLRRFARPQPEEEQCEFCSAPLNAAHRHLIETATRKLICACDPCALRFENVAGRWKLIPRDARALPEFEMSDGEWDAFALPIQLAFFFRSTSAGRLVAMYPSPAGPTESLLPLAGFESLAAANPCLAALEPDVEALLVNRLGAVPEHYIAPIDLCFELIGLIRVHWRGLSGGDHVWKQIDDFFVNLRIRTRPQHPNAVSMNSARA